MKYEEDGFDPTPYDRILSGIHTPARAADTEDGRDNEEMKSLSQIGDDAETGVPEPERTFDRPEMRGAEPVSEESFESMFAADREKEEREEREAEKTEAAARAESEEQEQHGEEEDSGTEEKPQAEPAAEKGDDVLSSLSEEEDSNNSVLPINDECDDCGEEENTLQKQSEENGEIPDTLMPTEDDADSGERIPLEHLLMVNDLKFTEIREDKKTRIYLEEDILVPDIKPDLAGILSMDVTVRCKDKEIKSSQKGEDHLRVNGEIALETVYLPEKASGESLVTIHSRLPFKTDWAADVPPFSSAVIQPTVESVDYIVVNERKFRAKITVVLTLREYDSRYLELFEDLQGEEIQTLKEKLTVTDVLLRKNDILDIDEDLVLRENNPVPEKIVRCGIHVVENHKQILADKAVISGSIYCDILYLTAPEDGENLRNGALDAEDFQDVPLSPEAEESFWEDEKNGPHTASNLEPAFYQGKVEFTQFIPLDLAEPQSGSRIAFDESGLRVRIKEVEEDESEASSIGFAVEGSIGTTLEIYHNLEEEIVTDVYHREKELAYSSEAFEAKTLIGNGVTELTAREIVNIPAERGDIDRIIYLSGKVEELTAGSENGKETVSGKVVVELLAIPAEEGTKPFRMHHSIPFRASMDIAGAAQDMTAQSDVFIRDLWCERINSRQIEVNAGILALGSVFRKERKSLIKEPYFVKEKEAEKRPASMILYITRTGDDLWKIAKKFRTTREKISRINHLEEERPVAEGTKLLILR